LPQPLANALNEARVPTGHAAFFVQRVDSAKPLLAHNADKRMNPASTMKIVTTYAALDLLGPAYTWKTQALADGAVREGKLDGNLYLRGSGDPSLTQERFLRQRAAAPLQRRCRCAADQLQKFAPDTLARPGYEDHAAHSRNAGRGLARQQPHRPHRRRMRRLAREAEDCQRGQQH
jgi:D-alanyl-D-alanine carboxypeptidase